MVQESGLADQAKSARRPARRTVVRDTSAIIMAILLNNRSGSRSQLGRRVARLLAGSWRSDPPIPFESSQELIEIAPLLLKSGAGALAWCKIRQTVLEKSTAAEYFHQAYRLQYLEAELHRRRLKKIIPLFRRFGVDPVLVKGWSIARLYPDVAMRPYCDLDLCVRPDEYENAMAALKSKDNPGATVDLHVGFGKFYDGRVEDIFSRSQILMLDELEVRMLSEEDNLRFLCMHFLRHGAVRPLWLCDIAVMLESLTDDFDWDRVLSGSRRGADWVGCAVGLTHNLLGVEIERTPYAFRARNLPGWLVPAVLQSWGTPFGALAEVRSLLRNPIGSLRRLPSELRRHWPNPIEATVALQGSFNRLPRLPFQIGHVVSRTGAFLSQVLEDLGGAIQDRS